MAQSKTALQAALETTEVKSFKAADEVREFPLGRLELIKVGGATIGRCVFEPGWRWSTSLQPVVKTKSCEAPHFQYHVSGRLEYQAANLGAADGQDLGLPVREIADFFWLRE